MALAGFGGENVANAEEFTDRTVARESNPVESSTPGKDREKKGLSALTRAKEALERGETAKDEASRRRAYEIASQEADEAVELLPDNADARFTQFGAEGRLAQMRGMAAIALALPGLNDQLKKVLELNPNHASALAARGGMLMKLPWLLGGDKAEGVRILEHAVALNPTGARAHLELAQAYEIVGRDPEAMQTGRKALRLAQTKGEDGKARQAADFVADLAQSCTNCQAPETAP